MEIKRNLLVTLADKNYILQAKQLFSSAYWNAGWRGDYMLLAHEIPGEELKWFRDKGILVKECAPLHSNFIDHYHPVVLDKFYLFTEEFKKWEHIVFLDSDMIVKGSLERLTKIRRLATVKDIGFRMLYSQFHNQPRQLIVNSTPCDLNVYAFNSGLISFNTDLITPTTFNELNSVFNDHISISKFGEQPLLNLFFYKKWKKLPVAYNVLMANYSLNLLGKLKCIIYHFVNNPNYPPVWDPDNFFYKEWKSNLDRAEFIDLNKPPEVKEWNVLKITFYSLLIKYTFLIPFIITHSSFYYKVRGFFVYKLKYIIRCIIYTPDRIIGLIGLLLKKNTPSLYYKLRKILGEK